MSGKEITVMVKQIQKVLDGHKGGDAMSALTAASAATILDLGIPPEALDEAIALFGKQIRVVYEELAP